MNCPEEHLTRLRRAIAWGQSEVAQAAARAQAVLDHANAEVSEALQLPAGSSINLQTGEISLPETEAQ